MSNYVKVSAEIGGRTLTLETGKVAKLANSAVIATYGESTVLATVVRDKPREGIDFFPMQVDYREKTSAAGKFPGGFRKREGAPNEKEILTMRMIDRPIRPLFPDGFTDEIQIQCWVMSHDTENDTDVLSGTAASAALAISDAPFDGPTATVRVGRIHTDDGVQLVINPTVSQMDYSDLDLVLAGHADGVNMIEVGAAEVSEAELLEAISFGHEQIKLILNLIDELVAKAGKEKVAGTSMLPSEEIVAHVKKVAQDEMLKARQVPGKADRDEAVGALAREGARRALPRQGRRHLRAVPRHLEQAQPGQGGLPHAREEDHAPSSSSRTASAPTAARPTRSARSRARWASSPARTAAPSSSVARRSRWSPARSAPPRTSRSSTAWCPNTPRSSRCTTTSRRSARARRGASWARGAARSATARSPSARSWASFPARKDFPYTIRLISDITESNGSSSMASICGGCLALMDAGVPIRNTCAGISVGRFTDENGDNELFVTDIIGEEDFFGDMDFKVGGTVDGITGVQLDLKARGLTVEQIERILEQARVARLDIIKTMEGVIPGPREKISVLAPRIVTLTIDPDKIGKLIGPGGKMIRALQDKYEVNIDVEDDGTVMVSATSGENIDAARAEIEALCEEIKVGVIYTGKVVSTKDFGAFIELAPGTDGMCHISELADGYVKNVSDVVKIGDIVRVKVLLVDDQGRIKLSRKAALAEEEGADAKAEEEPAEA